MTPDRWLLQPLRRLCAALALGLVLAQSLAAGVADEAAAASSALQEAIAAMQDAERGRDRVAGLTQTIRAYEQGLSALREALRQSERRRADLTADLARRQTRVAQLLAVLTQIGADQGPLMLLHPDGPLDSVRSGILLAEVTPGLQAEVDRLSSELQELAALRRSQDAATSILTQGLGAAQSARTALSEAIADRKDLPKRLIDDPAALDTLRASADTLDALAAGLGQPRDGDTGLFDLSVPPSGLPLPAFGRVIRAAGEPDSKGVARPGLTIATRSQALVTTPLAATIRYIGPLPDYGNVMMLEPGLGYLLVIAGPETLYGAIGDVVPAGTPIGLMGGPVVENPPDADEAAAEDTGQRGTETLYLELRRGAEPMDPAEWFATTTGATAPLGD